MTADRYERYEISNVPEGMQISHWQTLPILGPGLIVLVILAACFLTDPYYGHNRIWAGLGVVALALVALFGVKVETWIISDGAIWYKNGLWHKPALFQCPPGINFIAREEFVPCDSEGTQPAFPHVLHLIGPDEIEIGGGFGFRERSTMVRFLEALCESSPIEQTDLPSRQQEPDAVGQRPSIESDFRTD
jgi:hypothetical protein